METKTIKVVILCGGMGTRLKEETEFRPKPLVEVANRPIIWHIMKIYSHYGFNDFILCLGYKGEMVKEYFLNYEAMNNDFTINLNSKRQIVYHDHELREKDNWNVTLVDTGLQTQTGGRVKLIEKFIQEELFMLTYGDGVADINIDQVLRLHQKANKIGVLSAVHPLSRYGVIDHDHSGQVLGFKEKPRLDGLVNGGFFVFKKEFFNYLNKDSVLEKGPLEQLAQERQLATYIHTGFWKCMDTFKDANELNQMWNEGNAPWKIW
jgi:glucose-1-phosphate cytidylyltransferase